MEGLPHLLAHGSCTTRARLVHALRTRPTAARARAVSKEPDAYVYLAESIRAWPDQQELGRTLRRAGWDRVAYRNLTGGVVALHRARRP